MAEPFISEIRLVSFLFPPVGWAFCDGQILAISQNTALFALIGTTYGGNGVNTFALPNLQGLVALHQGNGFTIGERAGEYAHSLIGQELAPHSHPVSSGGNATSLEAVNNFFATPIINGQPVAHYSNTSDSTFAASEVLPDPGGSQPHPNIQPYLAMNYIIALNGIFPSRN